MIEKQINEVVIEEQWKNNYNIEISILDQIIMAFMKPCYQS